MALHTPAPSRQLKRNHTLMWCDATAAEALSTPAKDIEMGPPDAMPMLRPVPNLPLPMRGAKDFNAMDPPRQPPFKRASFEMEPPSLQRLRSDASVCSVGSVDMAAAVAAMPTPQKLFSSPPRARPPQSPQRLLTPRVSWSDITVMSKRQDSMDEGLPQQSQPSQPSQPCCSPPRTPVFRMRQAVSPPQRQGPVRRRPPSNDPDSPGRDQNEGRLAREFCGVTAIGKGQFSTVYRAQNRIDQCLYAVKKTTQITRGLRRTQLREVFALANVSMEAEGCPNIVRYFSSWLEDGRLHIQTELCECSLRDRLGQRRKEGSSARFSEPEIIPVIRDVANGLKVLHSCDFVHLDIKPDNILVSRNKREDGCYKIADLGLAAAAMGSGCDDISEGDCRYLAKEVLRGNLTELPKADVFALGLVGYELAINPRPLPCNGDEWQLIREGCLDLDSLSFLSEPLVELLRAMAAAPTADRPPCEEILQHPSISPEGDSRDSKEQLQRRLEASEAAVRKADADAKAAAAQASAAKQQAKEYWHEMLHLKGLLLQEGPKQAADAGVPSVYCRRSGAAPQPPVLRRGMTR